MKGQRESIGNILYSFINCVFFCELYPMFEYTQFLPEANPVVLAGEKLTGREVEALEIPDSAGVVLQTIIRSPICAMYKYRLLSMRQSRQGCFVLHFYLNMFIITPGPKGFASGGDPEKKVRAPGYMDPPLDKCFNPRLSATFTYHFLRMDDSNDSARSSLFIQVSTHGLPKTTDD